MFEIKGFAFSKNDERMEVSPGLKVTSYEEAENLFKEAGFTNYLYVLRKLKEEE